VKNTLATVEIDDYWRMHIGAHLLAKLGISKWTKEAIITVRKAKTIYYISAKA
jgi:hypothetical protein